MKSLFPIGRFPAIFRLFWAEEGLKINFLIQTAVKLQEHLNMGDILTITRREILTSIFLYSSYISISLLACNSWGLDQTLTKR